MHTRRWTAALVVAPLILLGCGSSDDSDEAGQVATSGDEPTTDPPATDPPATDPPATDPPVTEPTVTEPTAATELVDTEAAATEPAATQPAATQPADTDAADDVAVTMDEWLIEAPTDLPAGEITFAIQNDGSFPHEFVVIEGDGYESLPLASNGAVLEDDLPAGALIDRTDRIQGGLDGSLTVDLEAGNYVLLCNIVAGPTSHAGRGQVLDVTVG